METFSESPLGQIQEELNRIRQLAIADGRLAYDPDGQFSHALAPNGVRSNLEERQWVEVRSSSFKSWFGDWENDPQNASKIVDQNGEPLVLYHGTTRKFDSFSHEAPKNFSRVDNTKGAFFLTSDRQSAETEYARHKYNSIIHVLRCFNEEFFNQKAGWPQLIEKWNEFIRSIGTARVDLRHRSRFNIIQPMFDGHAFFETVELITIWDGVVPNRFNENDYDLSHWSGNQILVPKGSHSILMELFVNSCRPNYKTCVKEVNLTEMDNLFTAGMIEKGIYNDPDSTWRDRYPSFGSQPETDSVVVQTTNGHLSMAIFEPSQIKSATNNNGFYSCSSKSIYE